MITASYDPISMLYERYDNGEFVGLFASEADALGGCSRCRGKLGNRNTDQQSKRTD